MEICFFRKGEFVLANIVLLCYTIFRSCTSLRFGRIGRNRRIERGIRIFQRGNALFSLPLYIVCTRKSRLPDATYATTVMRPFIVFTNSIT